MNSRNDNAIPCPPSFTESDIHDQGAIALASNVSLTSLDLNIDYIDYADPSIVDADIGDVGAKALVANVQLTSLDVSVEDLIPESPRQKNPSHNFSIFSNMEKETLINQRHSSPNAQQAYDNCFGLIISNAK